MVFGFRRAAFVRVLPFVVFMAGLVLRGQWPAAWEAVLDARWLYGLTMLAVAALLAAWWREYGEFARANAPTAAEAALAVATGLAVFVLWIQLDAPWMQLAAPSAAFEPLDAAGRLDPALVVMRWVGAALLVPVMEELFWRSFLMRWIEQPVFEGVDPRRVGLKAVVVSTFLFVLAHTLWLAALIAGLAYAWLYRRSGRLWVPVLAHAVTNGALGIWVVATGRWDFW